ncbi:uncharacterized protein [Drosophila virilis]|uniref:Drovipin-4 mRNA n=1 Tax=Drosophila virilis TaxID=7244 RepID=B4LKI1_DROVI|nr:uncharacterized protein LOC116651215 [Drosophila virilis]AJM71454.1 drovipin-4 [Drosophila virilis]
MLSERPLAALCFGILLCCLLIRQSEGFPPTVDNIIPMPKPQMQTDYGQFQNTGMGVNPILQSIFTVPEICPEGFKLTSDRQRCRKIA